MNVIKASDGRGSLVKFHSGGLGKLAWLAIYLGLILMSLTISFRLSQKTINVFRDR